MGSQNNLTGITTPVNSADIENDFTGNNFTSGYFTWNESNHGDFDQALTDALTIGYYDGSTPIEGDIDFGNKSILELNEINGINVGDLFSNCVSLKSSLDPNM